MTPCPVLAAVTIKRGPASADVRQVRHPRRAAIVLAAGLVLAVAPTQPAQAESAADARAAARQAAGRVAALQPRVQRALAAYQKALDGIAGTVSRSIEADQAADAAQALADQRQAAVGNQVRALYMSGGSAALAASVLSAPNATVAFRRVAYVQRLVQSTTVAARGAGTAATAALDAAAGLEAQADRRVVTAADVTRRYDELSAVLASASGALAALSDRARHLTQAEAAAARLRALAAAAASSAASRVSTARASAVPADFKRLYVGASKTCPGLSWTVLAAIGQVESGHGRNAGTSSAGAQGPMQFLPETFAHYAVDGDHDGDKDIFDPADAIFTAARYLCANGAGHGGDSLARAIWHYNHADWYVQLVLRLAGQLAAAAEPGVPLGSG